jgi:hypothetical protein
MNQPDVRPYGLLDLSAYESIAKAGYQAAREQPVRWQDRRDAV